MKRSLPILSLSILLGISGCSLAPELTVPTVQIPTSSTTEALHVKAQWWKDFHDEKLNALVHEALLNSDDLKLQALRVLKAKQAYGLSDAARYPTLSANAGASRIKLSDETYQHNRTEYSDHTLGLSLQYELDFWNKLEGQSEANWSAFLGTKAARDTLKNTLINDVVVAYFNLGSLNERIAVMDDTITTYEQSYAFREKQLKAGTINDLLANQAKAQFNNAKSTKASLLETKSLQENALAILVGKTPKALFEKESIEPNKLPTAIVIPKGIPSTLMENRPDIKEALENLKSKNALIGVEKSAYFPSISLTGSYGQQSQSLNNILQSTANKWSFGPTLNVPIFDFDRIKTRVNMSETDLKSALIGYELSVKKAYKEVSDALTRYNTAQSKLSFQAEELNAYTKMLNISTIRFDKGAANQLEVLDARKGMLNASLSLISTKQALLSSEAELFKALGGGWDASILINHE
ncbi:MAG: TolC family protein [Sulfurospirillaceae bacterium]|nr:TolC family protein [Sulfurospirillaceae bacterium]MDD2826663.1 TolC family protein [Sulfurospirillaceae bacterium]